MKKINKTLLEKLVNNLLYSKGRCQPKIRQVIYQKAQNMVLNRDAEVLANEVLERYIEKITRYAYKITDEDIHALRDANFSQAQIFELSVTAALGAGKTYIDIVQKRLLNKD